MREHEKATDISKYIEALMSHENYSFYYFELRRLYIQTVGDTHFDQCFNRLLKSEFLVTFGSCFIVNIETNFRPPQLPLRMRQQYWSESKRISEDYFKNLNLN